MCITLFYILSVIYQKTLFLILILLSVICIVKFRHGECMWSPPVAAIGQRSTWRVQMYPSHIWYFQQSGMSIKEQVFFGRYDSNIQVDSTHLIINVSALPYNSHMKSNVKINQFCRKIKPRYALKTTDWKKSYRHSWNSWCVLSCGRMLFCYGLVPVY